MGKILETLMATRVAQMVEAHHLLHPDQIGGQPQHSAIDTVMALTHKIDTNAGTKWVMSALFLDVRGAFDNVSSARILHTMSQLGCPKAVLSWGKSFLVNRTTALSFDGRTDIQRPINTGIPQGSPASPILFLLYLRHLFDALKTAHPMLWAPSYIDDVALVTNGMTREDNAHTLEKATQTAFKWADENATTFDDSKSEKPHFHRARQDTPPDAINITLPNGTIMKPGTQGGRKDVIHWIGILFDRKLRFIHHINAKLISASRSFNALCSLVKHETSLSPSATHSLYRSCVLSRSNFGTEIWWTGQKTFTKCLQIQQNAALRRILNAFRSTLTIALHNETALPPVSIHLQSNQRKYVLYLLTLPPSHPIIKRCPSSFPVPNHLSTTLCDPDEYDLHWTQNCRPPSRLGKALHALSPWVPPDADIEDTAQPMTAPWNAPTITVNIQDLPKDEAVTAHLSLIHNLRDDPHNVIACTDGWQLSTQTGAGFCIPHSLPNPVRTVIPLGTTSEVFDAELKAIAECLCTSLKYIKWHRLHDRSIHLFTDNQSAILRASRLHRGPGQETALDILHNTNALLQRSAPVTLYWVPGHTDIEGNEEADRLAKLATSRPPLTSTPITLSWL
jgi:ribonuclease HI